MKVIKRKYVFTLVLLMLTNSGLFAQVNPLAGTWLIDVNKSAELISGIMKERYDSLDSNGQARVQNAMSGRVFTFHTNGTFNVTWKAGGQTRESEGTWTVTETYLLKIILWGNISEFDYSLEEDELRLSNREVSGFFTTLCFTRQ